MFEARSRRVSSVQRVDTDSHGSSFGCVPTFPWSFKRCSGVQHTTRSSGLSLGSVPNESIMHDGCSFHPPFKNPWPIRYRWLKYASFQSIIFTRPQAGGSFSVLNSCTFEQLETDVSDGFLIHLIFFALPFFLLAFGKYMCRFSLDFLIFTVAVSAVCLPAVAWTGVCTRSDACFYSSPRGFVKARHSVSLMCILGEPSIELSLPRG